MPDDAIEAVVRERDALRDRARRVLGVTGSEDDDAPPLAEVLRRSNVRWYPLVALGALVVVDEFQRTAFVILAPDIAGALGISKAAIGALLTLSLLAVGLATLPMAAYVQNRPRRAFIAIATAIVWSLTTVWAGFVTALVGLFIVMLLDGATTGSTQAVHQPLLMDSYPPESRVRMLTAYRAADQVGKILAPLLIFLLALFAFTWRGVFLGLGIVSVAATLIALRLRDPGFGRFDTGRIRELVRAHGEQVDERSQLEERTELGFFEIVRRLFLIPTQRRLLAAFGVYGVFVIPFQTYLSFFLDEKWGLDTQGRALFGVVAATAAVVALGLFSHRAEEVFRRDPSRSVQLTGWLLVVALGAIALGSLMPVFGLVVAFFVLASSLLPAMLPSFYMSSLSIVPPNMRPHTMALITIFITGVGGPVGLVLLGSLDRRFGIEWALVATTVPGILGALILRSAGRTVTQDLDRMIDEVIEDEEVRELARSGTHLPMLACRGIDFSYGQVQVLFDVGFTVDDGEMVALLGVNGAGKSTLLKVISGLGLPARGSVRMRGVDITYLDAERRVNLGIQQVPGGHAVFGPLSVVDNLELYGYTLRKDRRAVKEAIDTAFDAFPRLAERRNQAAQTLSGGEQQMLALSKALMLEPRLLLIDELSLGLAPVIVSQLLDMVRRINGEGTAVVLVEQSVNVALSLVDHAYFMEKGEIRFDGPAMDLLGREDLLRSVFLRGAAAGGH
ncbi:MAG TPA: MFS transporter [Nitriliruptorales bacterium]